LHRHGEVVVPRQTKRIEQRAAVRVRIRAHAPRAGRGERSDLLDHATFAVEELVRTVRAHPLFERSQVLRIVEAGDRHLVRTPGALDGLAVDEARTGPALRRVEYDHRPASTRDLRSGPFRARTLLD